MTAKVALVIGAGDSTGSAIAKRFAREGYVACLVRRNGDQLQPQIEEIEAAGGTAHAFGVDARREEQMVDLFAGIERDIGPIDVCVHNVGGNVRFSILDEELTGKKFYKIWEMSCFSGFLSGREAARRMAPRGRGTILFTGATASMRGAEGYCGFSAGKAGLRPSDIVVSINGEIIEETSAAMKTISAQPPGSVITLRQKRPSMVVEIEATTLAMERDIAADIFVRRERRS